MNNLHIIALNYRVGHCKSVATVQPMDCTGRTKRTDEDYGWPQSLDHEMGKIRCVQTAVAGADQSV